MKIKIDSGYVEVSPEAARAALAEYDADKKKPRFLVGEIANCDGCLVHMLKHFNSEIWKKLSWLDRMLICAPDDADGGCVDEDGRGYYWKTVKPEIMNGRWYNRDDGEWYRTAKENVVISFFAGDMTSVDWRETCVDFREMVI